MIIKCPHCDYSSKHAGRVQTHLEKVHNEIPEELYIKLFHDGIRPTCACSETCNIPMAWWGWEKGFPVKYAKGHNARIDSCFFDKELHKKMGEKRGEGYRTGKYLNPMKGKTKEISETVAAAGKKISAILKEKHFRGEITLPQTGKTKENCEQLWKMSETKKRMYANGEIEPWNKGLTKENSFHIAETARKISDTVSNNQDASDKRFKENEIFEIIEEYAPGLFILITDPKDYRNKYQKIEIQCTKCFNNQKKTMMMIKNSPKCFFCHPKESVAQLEIYNFVKNLCDDAELSNRTVINPKEIDIVVPSRRIAIEYNGLYYHSEECLKDYKTYHYNKTLICEKAGYELFHIFQDEWKYNSEIIKSMLKSKLGLIDKKIFARKCEIKEILIPERRKFFNINHLNGDANSKKAWGLFYDKQLVSVLSIRRPRQKKKYSDAYEITRFACLLDTIVIGGFSKLVKYAIEWIKKNDPKIRRLMSYVDLEHGNGKSYEKTGFSLIGITVNKFYWTDGHYRMHRLSTKADKSKNMSQQDVANEKGVFAIYGCPNKVFELKIS